MIRAAMRRPRITPRETLPCITDEPKRAFLAGWFSGISVGFILAIALVVIVAKGVR